jgi:hypothetical protein
VFKEGPMNPAKENQTAANIEAAESKRLSL